MKLIIEIAAATLLVVCVSGSSAAFAEGRQRADGLSCCLQRAQGRIARRALLPPSSGSAAASTMRTTAATGCCRR